MRKLIVHDVEYDLAVSTLQWVVQIRALMDDMPYIVRRYVSLDTIHTSDHTDVLYERCIEQAVHELIEATQPDEVVYEPETAYYTLNTAPTYINTIPGNVTYYNHQVPTTNYTSTTSS